ncbi:MAG: hypothetical protein SVM80_06505 [Halobacteriota archaeon]|nr:hypothetical protein [Halobacteriota archaeon]
MILSKIELDDSLSKVQLKTGLSFATVQKTVRGLERRGIIRTRENITKKGRAKECVKISQTHKKAAIFYLDMVGKMSHFLSSSTEFSPILFEIKILEVCLDRIGESLSQDDLIVFNRWLKSIDGSIDVDKIEGYEDFYDIKDGKAEFFPENFEIKVKSKKIERDSTEQKTLDMLM